MPRDVYMWKDQHDPDTYCLGVKLSSGKFSHWTALFVDCIDDCFGTDALTALKETLPEDGTPVEVRLTLEVAT